MDFQIKYVKKGNFDIVIEDACFKNEADLKRWYKSKYEKGEVEFSFFEGWNKTLNKPFSYKIRT